MIPAHLLAKFPLRRGKKKSAVVFTWTRLMFPLCLLFRNFKNWVHWPSKEKKKWPNNSKFVAKSGMLFVWMLKESAAEGAATAGGVQVCLQGQVPAPGQGMCGFHCRTAFLCCLWGLLHLASSFCHFASFRQTGGKWIRVPLVYLKCKLQQY